MKLPLICKACKFIAATDAEVEAHLQKNFLDLHHRNYVFREYRTCRDCGCELMFESNQCANCRNQELREDFRQCAEELNEPPDYD